MPDKTITVQTIPCCLCGKTERVTVERDKWVRYMNGAKVQDVWPEMDANWREMLMTGTHGDCYDAICKDLEG